MAFVKPLNVKMTYASDMRRMRLESENADPSFTAADFYPALCAKVASAYNIDQSRLRLQYVDDEGDLVTIASKDDLALALDVLSVANGPVPLLRLTVTQEETTPEPMKMRLTVKHNGPAPLPPAAMAEIMKKALPQAMANKPMGEEGMLLKLPDNLSEMRKLLKEVAQPQRRVLKLATIGAWASACASAPADAPAGAPLMDKLPDEVAKALSAVEPPELRAKIGVHLRHAFLGAPRPTPEESPSSGKMAEGIPPEAMVIPDRVRRMLQRLPPPQRTKMVNGVLAAWPPAPKAGSTCLPPPVRNALADIPRPILREQFRAALREVWFGGSNNKPTTELVGEEEDNFKTNPCKLPKHVRLALKEAPFENEEKRDEARTQLRKAWVAFVKFDCGGMPKRPTGDKLPTVLRVAIDEFPKPTNGLLRQAFRVAVFQQLPPPPAPVVTGDAFTAVSADDEEEGNTNSGKLPKYVRILLKQLSEPVRKAVAQPIKQAWANKLASDAGGASSSNTNKMLPEQVRTALQQAPIPLKFQLRQALRKAWFGEEPAPSADAPPEVQRMNAMAQTMEKRKWLARFVQHVTVPEETPLPPETLFTKVWKVRNDANEPWPKDSVLINVSCEEGEPLYVAPPGVPVGLVLAPGESTDIAVTLATPSKPGLYEAFFRLQDPNGGRKFGQRLKCSVVVTDDGTSKELRKEAAELALNQEDVLVHQALLADLPQLARTDAPEAEDEPKTEDDPKAEDDLKAQDEPEVQPMPSSEMKLVPMPNELDDPVVVEPPAESTADLDDDDFVDVEGSAAA